ncbi:ScbR family autoregulator-binding transcription factor [Micromonospora sp. WMMC241]|uniref:ScbR family autoregulator-binding transcription factor n=1 Tax=Micromonospora sp. WMMC241 TaxID=3015159 RepID=UPI0022B65BA2|nr:ScbR family autoregulator-binding transcription factor [Micromonospora sp. WMMC241]MCZ7440050.1 ScbR family autoregulator-binding transcription factor [Micromonospora sp. WMMC241]
MAKQARAEQTRTAILSAAADVFDRFGYDTASLGDIISTAGVTKGALYFHFGSKSELAQAVVELQHVTWMRIAESAAAPENPALTSMIRLSHALAAQMISDPVIRGGIRLTLERGSFEHGGTTPYLDWIAMTRDLLDRGVEESDIRAETDVAAVAHYIVGSFTGLQLLAHVLDERPKLNDAVTQMWKLLLPALVSAPRLGHFLDVAAETRSQFSAQPV